VKYPGELELPRHPGTKWPPRYPAGGVSRFQSKFLAPIRFTPPRSRLHAMRLPGDTTTPQWPAGRSSRHSAPFPAGRRQMRSAWGEQTTIYRSRQWARPAELAGSAETPRSRIRRSGPSNLLKRPMLLKNEEPERARSPSVAAFSLSRREWSRLPAFSRPARNAHTFRSQSFSSVERPFSPSWTEMATRHTDPHSWSIRGEGQRGENTTSGLFERFRKAPSNNAVGHAADMDMVRAPLNPALNVDELELGDWIGRYLERQSMRPPASMTGSDPRLTPVWAGPSFGF
jgi:hypothetical protein